MEYKEIRDNQINNLFYNIKTIWADKNGCFSFKYKMTFREIKYAFQRFYKGYDDRSYMNMNRSFFYICKSLLKEMINNSYTYPLNYKNYEEWNDVLIHMVYCLDKMYYHDDKISEEWKDSSKIRLHIENKNKYEEEFFKLLKENISDLWI